MKKYFGTDGIRGKVGEFPMHFEFLVKLGYVVGKRFPSILMVRDTRESSEEIQNYVAWGAMEAGAEVVSGEVLPTSALAFFVKEMGFNAGIAISASHNPFYENGVKILGRDGRKLKDQAEVMIEREVDALKYVKVKKRSYRRKDLGMDYVKKIMEKAGLEKNYFKGWKIGLDAGNGAAFKVAGMLFDLLGAEVIITGHQPDGRNINETGAVRPQALSGLVQREGAEVGFCYDGDADRCIWCDERGRVLDGDNTLHLMAVHMLEKGSLTKKAVVATVMSNFALDKVLSEKGIKVLRSAVGDRYVYELMVKEGAKLGGEQSGHTIFLDYLPTGDGLLTSVLILKALKEREEKASLWRDLLQPFPQQKKNFPVKKKIPLEELPQLTEVLERLKDKFDDKIYVVVRYSGTEYLLRVSVQGEKEEWVKECMDEIEKSIREIKDFLEGGSS